MPETARKRKRLSREYWAEWWRDVRGKTPDRHGDDPLLRSMANLEVWLARLLIPLALLFVVTLVNAVCVLAGVYR